MKVLVVGGGGREHAVVDALSRSPQVSKIYCAPGNAGIARQAECVPVKDTDVEGLLSLAREKEIDLTVVGPEAALVAGIVDRFREEGLRIFGPTKAAARIESSKEFAKDLMGRYGIPTAGYRAFDDYRKASEYVRSRPLPAVLKYDGLAAGKGVVIARTMEEADAALRDMLLDDKFGKGRVVVEDFLTGPEFSFMCFVSVSYTHLDVYKRQTISGKQNNNYKIPTTMQQGEMLYEGKAKQVFLTDDPDMILIHYKDAATAFKMCIRDSCWWSMPKRPSRADWR